MQGQRPRLAVLDDHPTASRPHARDEEGREIRGLTIAAAVVLLLVCVAPARGDLARHHRHARYPAWWMAQARCIHWHEAVSSSPATTKDLRAGWRIHWHLTRTYAGQPSVNHGGFQISLSTWASYAPRGYPSDPANAKRAQQVQVAHRIWTANGHSWGANGQWPGTAAACGIA